MSDFSLLRQAERLRGVAAMGGFTVTLAEAERAVLDAEIVDRQGGHPTLAETLQKLREANNGARQDSEAS